MRAHQALIKLGRHRDNPEVTVHKRTLALSKAKEVAAKANWATTQFPAKMSHELRTPMNGIAGIAMLAPHRATNPTQTDQLEKAAQFMRHLVGIVNDVHDIVRIEADQLTLEQVTFPQGDVIGDLVALTSRPRGRWNWC